jgi:TetR/AcrR family transcriptional regulator
VARLTDVKTPPAELAGRLLDVSEHVLAGDPPPRLEDVAGLVGASRATLYYYFSGRDDLLAFLLTEHARQGAESVDAAVKPDDPPQERLQVTLAALADFLGRHPGVCAGLLAAAGAGGRMAEVLQAIDTWIARPLRDLLDEGHRTDAFVVDDAFDAANALLGGLLVAVLSRSIADGDTADPQFHRRLAEQATRSVLPH